VTVNYRLGAFGHLGRADACDLPLPAADVLLSLRWVADHIRTFGGNPDRITVSGQSAGGWYAHLLSVLPRTRGIVHRLCLLSMGTREPWTPQGQAEVTDKAAKLLGGIDPSKVPADALLDAGARALGAPSSTLGYAPAAFLPVASAGLPEKLLDAEWAAKACHAEAVYLRNTADESAAFLFASPLQTDATQAQVDAALSAWNLPDLPPKLQRHGAYTGAASGLSPYRQLVAASSWRQFQRFPSEYASALLAGGKEAKLEVFHGEGNLPGFQCGHCLDLPFQFGTRLAWENAPMLSGFDDERFEVISRHLISQLVAFVASAPAPSRI
jgi:para-nitrobenzyl esterase